MPSGLLRIIQVAALAVIICVGQRAYASHIVGGEFTYKFMGSGSSGDFYQFTLIIYEDCLHGTPDAIVQDNPAYLAVYDGLKNRIYFDSVFFNANDSVPVNVNTSCVQNVEGSCLLKKTFVRNYLLPHNESGYTVAYQRCCRNSGLINIENPGNAGSTYFCEIPPPSVVANNNSAVFTNYPPQVICVNEPLTYDNSATDADGDSLTYELCNSFDSPNGVDRNSPPKAPPYTPSTYVHPPYSFTNPLTGAPPVTINPVTGIISCTPTALGRYLVTVCCNEWRNGAIINTMHREFQFVVTNCSRTVVANMPYFTDDPGIYQVNCRDHTITFKNTSTGSSSWHWDFGVSGAVSDTSAAFEPTFVYADSGTYRVKLIADPGAPCSDSIVKQVKVYPTFFTAFTDTGRFCATDSILFKDHSFGTGYQASEWLWNFGDGTTSSARDPVHTFASGSTYNVMLVSGNQDGCVDSSLRQVTVEQFTPFAGEDTIIVKGSSIRFSASGGIQYSWQPSESLVNPNSANPIGYYPDTGRYSYSVHILSAYGCTGFDTINVWVVSQSAFYMPTAFSPNGDGINDIFRPVAIGFKELKFFRIYNRWGQEVYYGNSLSVGWDGTYDHKAAEMGTYFWQIGFIDRLGKEGNMKGEITLVR